MVVGFLKYVQELYPDPSAVEAVLVTGSMSDLFKIQEVLACVAPEDQQVFRKYFRRWIDLGTLYYRSKDTNWLKAGVSNPDFLEATVSALELSHHKGGLAGLVKPMFDQSTVVVDKTVREGDDVKKLRLLANPEFLNLLEPTEITSRDYNVVIISIQVIDIIVSPAREVIPALATISYKTKEASSFHALSLRRREGSFVAADAKRLGYALVTNTCQGVGGGKGEEEPHYCWPGGKCVPELDAITDLMDALLQSAPNIILFPSNTDRGIGVLLSTLSKLLLYEEFRGVVSGVGSLESLASEANIVADNTILDSLESFYRSNVLNTPGTSSSLSQFKEKSADMLWAVTEKLLHGPITYANFVSKHCSPLHSRLTDGILSSCGLPELRPDHHIVLLAEDTSLVPRKEKVVRIIIEDPAKTCDSAYFIYCYGPLHHSVDRVLVDQNQQADATLVNSSKSVLNYAKNDLIGLACKTSTQLPFSLNVRGEDLNKSEEMIGFCPQNKER